MFFSRMIKYSLNKNDDQKDAKSNFMRFPCLKSTLGGSSLQGMLAVKDYLYTSIKRLTRDFGKKEEEEDEEAEIE